MVMNVNIFKFSAIVLILAVFFSFCSEKTNHEDENDENEGNSIEITENEIDDMDYEIVAFDPNETILGKWELVQLIRYENNKVEDEHRWEPTGYVEYLPDSLMGWYDYTTKEYTLCKGKYWVRDENGADYVFRDKTKYRNWILYYQLIWIRDGEYIIDSRPNYPYSTYPDEILEQYQYYPDKEPNRIIFSCYFLNQNMLSLWSPKGIVSFPEYIYKRVN